MKALTQFHKLTQLYQSLRALIKFSTLFIVSFSFAQRPDTLAARNLNEVVVSASRIKENYLKSASSIEVLTLKQISQSPALSYFDAIENLKGVQLITPSLGFRVYNARGFTNTTNVRFVQLVDGIDNQAPHVGAPIAAAMGPTDLDIRQVELIPGVASALYGMNSLNGLVNLLTLNPFEATGLSIQQKTGVNHLASEVESPQLYSETSLRYAQKWSERWAFKVNISFQRGHDWVANSDLDLNPAANSSVGLLGRDNVGADLVNSYGNESANRRTLTLNGKRYVVARTGYFENEVTNYAISNKKADFSLHYRIKPRHEIAYLAKVSQLDNVYQRANRFRLNDYLLAQHALTFESPNTQIKAYLTTENTGKSYNIRSMAENIDRSFKSDNTWFSDFTAEFNAQTKSEKTPIDALNLARTQADKGRPQPNTPAIHNVDAQLTYYVPKRGLQFKMAGTNILYTAIMFFSSIATFGQDLSGRKILNGALTTSIISVSGQTSTNFGSNLLVGKIKSDNTYWAYGGRVNIASNFRGSPDIVMIGPAIERGKFVKIVDKL